MPRPGKYDDTYPNKLKKIGIKIVGEFKGSKKHHLLECIKCGHQWSATPISKLQNYKRCGIGGCPECTKKRRFDDIRKRNIKLIKQKVDILSPYDGQSQTTIKITVRNKECGHIFKTYPGNLLHRNIECTVCGKDKRSKQLTKTSKDRSKEWYKTATEWQRYKSKVYSLTITAYRKHHTTINPTDLPRGKAGHPGAYHLDHIVPIRYCFENNIPTDICAHYTNLQMIEWEDNIVARDKLKGDVDIPVILKEYIPSI